MKKWIFIIIIVFIIIIWRSISIFQTAVEPIKTATEKAIEIALNDTKLQSIEETYTYYGTKEYQVLLGEDNESEKMIVWISEDGKEIITRKQSDGITEKEAIQELANDHVINEIRSVKLGIEDEIPIWEIIYTGEDNRITYHKLYFENGRYRNSIKP